MVLPSSLTAKELESCSWSSDLCLDLLPELPLPSLCGVSSPTPTPTPNKRISACLCQTSPDGAYLSSSASSHQLSLVGIHPNPCVDSVGPFNPVCPSYRLPSPGSSVHFLERSVEMTVSDRLRGHKFKYDRGLCPWRVHTWGLLTIAST